MDMNNYIVLFPILLYVYCCNCFFLLFFTKELHFFFCFIFTFDLIIYLIFVFSIQGLLTTIFFGLILFYSLLHFFAFCNNRLCYWKIFLYLVFFFRFCHFQKRVFTKMNLKIKTILRKIRN